MSQACVPTSQSVPSAPVGLTSAEAAERLAADGPNELASAPDLAVWRRVLSQFQDLLVYLLLVGVLISILAWVSKAGTAFRSMPS